MNEDDQKELSDIHDVSTWRRGQPTISLYYTALHELGHTLGLDHSIDANDVMSPWYNPKQLKLSKNDKRRLIKVAIYGQKSNGAKIIGDDDEFVGNENVNQNAGPVMTVNFMAQDDVIPGFNAPPISENMMNGNDDEPIGDDFTFNI